MLSLIIAIIKTLVMLGILVIIHEGGHFVVAKLCKVKVNEFSIGFGKNIWSKEYKGTKYSVRLIPFRWLCCNGRGRRSIGCRRLFQ